MLGVFICSKMEVRVKKGLNLLGFLVAFLFAGCGGEEEKTCGNYLIDAGEICDGNSKECSMLIPGTRGTASCRYDCSGFDTSSCQEPYCGDGIKDSDEYCDSDYKNCSELVSGTKGQAACKYDCSGYDTSSCREPVCGDNETDSGEVCDGNSVLCETLDSSYYGNAACNSSCGGYEMDSCMEFQEVTVSLTDQCDDGEDILFRLFQFADSDSYNYDRFWPEDSSKVFVSNGLNQEAATKIYCEKSKLICYGGKPEDSDSTYWGVGINGNKGCEGCCFECQDGVEKSIDLICGSGEVSSCTTNSDCSSNDVCFNSKCVSPLGLSWYIYAKSMTFDDTKPNGDDWDLGLGDFTNPDIVALVLKNEEIILQTEEISDTFSASWSNEKTLTEINVGDTIQFCAVDIDVDGDDVASCVSASGNDLATLLKQGSFTENDYDMSGLLSFMFTFELFN